MCMPLCKCNRVGKIYVFRKLKHRVGKIYLGNYADPRKVFFAFVFSFTANIGAQNFFSLSCLVCSVLVNSNILTVNYDVKQSQFTKPISEPRASDPEESNETFDRAICHTRF